MTSKVDHANLPPREMRLWDDTIEFGEIHGLTSGKLYQFRGDCAECQVEACERQQTGGVLVEPRREIVGRLVVTEIAFDHSEWPHDWTIVVTSSPD